jgi:hypothetical protein
MRTKKSAAERAIEGTAIRLCREADRLRAGRMIRWWSNGWEIGQSLGLEDEAAREAWRYARARRWVETSHGYDVGMVTLLEDGRQLFAEENRPPPAPSEAAASRGRPPRKRPAPSRGR